MTKSNKTAAELAAELHAKHRIDPQAVRQWLERGNFSPTDAEVEAFEDLLTLMKRHKKWSDFDRNNGVEEFDPWHLAVDTLRRELPGVIKRTMEVERLFNEVLTPESRSAELARLLIAARETWIPLPFATSRIDDGRHEWAQRIAKFVASVTPNPTKKVSYSVSHVDAKIIVIVVQALETIGYAGINAAAVVKALQRSKSRRMAGKDKNS